MYLQKIQNTLFHFLKYKNGTWMNRINTRLYHADSVFGYDKRKSDIYELPQNISKARSEQSNLVRLIDAYRHHGHKIAEINPVSIADIPDALPLLDSSKYGLSKSDKISSVCNLLNTSHEIATVEDAENFLKNVYCDKIGVEFMHLNNDAEIEWFGNTFEKLKETFNVKNETKLQLLKYLLESQVFEQFLATKFPSFKRYGGEGAESFFSFFLETLQTASREKIEEIVIGTQHRGRLSLLTGMLRMPVEKLLRKLKGFPDFPEKFQFTGDVVSHLISSTNIESLGRDIHVTVLYNPSHLEVVNPVSMGKTRSKQMTSKDGHYCNDSQRQFGDKVLNIQVHGDAALPGQGINQEALNLSRVPHFEIGGTVHLVINNQVGFTTPSDRGRSSSYCTDVAKMISAPVIHVNGNYPEEVLKATSLAVQYQRMFRKDIFVDLNCYRKRGHNELDDPTFTNPFLYKLIDHQETVPNMYAKKIISEHLTTEDYVENLKSNYNEVLNKKLREVDTFKVEDPCFKRQWTGFSQAPAAITVWDTGVDASILRFIGNRSVTVPDGFNVHPQLVKSHINTRLSKIANGTKIDWATAEALAFGSLLYQGFNVRISGQDVGRGTFSQRHAMLIDQATNKMYIPLNNLKYEKQGFLEVANSILSEEAVLAFEYGMSIDNPNNLIIWEAQFGDFFNGAQIILDTFISCGEAKWLTSSGIVILLPHGYDGAGPDHSSSRFERFLQMTDSSETRPDGENVNMHVVNPTTPAQYFHLLRLQMMRNYRKPLIVVAPKTMLRLSSAVSTIDDMKPGSSFSPVIGDESLDREKVKKVIFVTGKHYYALLEERGSQKIKDTAIIRIECLSPFPVEQIHRQMENYKNASVLVWSQEEPRNMGAWSFVETRFRNLLGRNLIYCGRKESAAAAVGISTKHSLEARDVVKTPFALNK